MIKFIITGILLVCFLLLSGKTWLPTRRESVAVKASAQDEGRTEVRSFIARLPAEQRQVVEDYCDYLAHSFAGYTLYGEKPIAIEAYSNHCEGELDRKSLKLKRGLWLWERLGVSPEDKNFCLVTLNAHGYRHCIVMNRRAFLEVVNANLTLFQYALGPKLTAEQLFEALIHAGDNFYNLLKNDNALLGILLGYGTKNSLLVSKSEELSNSFDLYEDFPLLPQKVRRESPTLPRSQKMRPAIGFKTINEEIRAIDKEIAVSRKLKRFDLLQIPHFGCVPDSTETEMLLKSYEKTHFDLEHLLSSGNLLEETLLKLLKRRSGGVEIPAVPSLEIQAIPANLDDPSEKKSPQFLYEQFLEELAELCKEKREEVRLYFEQLQAQKELTEHIPGKLYYKVLREGRAPANGDLSTVSFHYSYEFLGRKRGVGTLDKEALSQIIPGLALLLPDMKEGEKRKIYIHPDYAYEEDTDRALYDIVIAEVERLE